MRPRVSSHVVGTAAMNVKHSMFARYCEGLSHSIWSGASYRDISAIWCTRVPCTSGWFQLGWNFAVAGLNSFFQPSSPSGRVR